MRSIAIDIGNTGIKYGIFEGDALVKQGCFENRQQLPPALRQESFDHAIVSSVAEDT